MKKYNHPIDDFFRENLKDQEMAPSDAAKQAFLRDGLQVPLPARKRIKWLFIVSTILILVSSGIFYWTVKSDKITTGLTNKSSKTQSVSDQTIQQLIKQESSIKAGKKQPTEEMLNQVAEKLPVVIITEQMPSSNIFPTGISSAENSLPKTNEILQQGNTDSLEQLIPMAIHQETIRAIDNQESVILPDSSATEIRRDAAGRHNSWIPSVGVYYTPELIFNTLDGAKFVSNFGLEGTFYFDRFSVRTGAGLSILKGTNVFMVEYNDYLGAYNKLDSMQFTWSSPARDYIPEYFMSYQDVWDSLLKSDYPKVVKRYTYLQIPMILGYEVWQTKNLSIGIRTGPVLSILVYSKNLSGDYDPGLKRVYSINDMGPGQVNLNWQLLGGVNVSVRLNRMLRIEIEPDAKYYFNPVNEKLVNNNKPWSIGIRAACIVKF